MSEISQVLILGAGASASDGAPVQGMLIEKFCNMHKFLPSHRLNATEKLINNYFKAFWGFGFRDRNIGIYPTFEECLSVLDLAFARNEGYKGFSKDKISDCRRALIYLIADLLDKKLKKPFGYCKKLIDKLIEAGEIKYTSFISLNYDIILDNVLADIYDSFHLDYGIDFINFQWEGDWHKPSMRKSILLLKIHGSLNWVYCPTCDQIELEPKTKEGAIKACTGEKKCRDCNSLMEPVIIPPTFYKDMKNPFIQQIFNKTFKILRKTDRIIFCGYSFPDADMHLKYLIKKAELYKGKSFEVYIINNHDGKEESNKKDEKSRYERFFREKEKVHYTNLSFAEFCEKGISELKDV